MNINKVDRWKEMLATCEADILRGIGYRKYWREIQEGLQENPAFAGSLPYPFRIFTDWYVSYQLIRVRRHVVDTRPDDVSLARILFEMREEPDAISRAWFVSIFEKAFPIHGTEEGNEGFDHYAGSGDSLSEAWLDEQSTKMKECVEKLKSYTDKRTVHASALDVPDTPSFNDLDRGIDLIAEVWQELGMLLNQVSTPADITPQWDWLEHFRVPWIVRGELD